MDDDGFADVRAFPHSVRAVVDHAYAYRLCAGHFPGDPILPGAQLAGLMARAAARVAGSGRQLDHIVRCVFLARVHPDDEIVISAAHTTAGDIDAEVYARGRCAARATFRFGGAAA